MSQGVRVGLVGLKGLLVEAQTEEGTASEKGSFSALLIYTDSNAH